MWKDEIFKKMLSDLDRNYDEQVGLLSKQINSVHYHSDLCTQTVHTIYDSLCYACCLLDTGEAERIKQAVRIVKTAIQYQDKNRNSKTYGVYSCYMEEPVWTVSAPDINQADFCTKELIYIILYHSKYFTEDTLDEIKACIRRSCDEIKTRDVYYDYTNISLMAVYVLYTGGQILGDGAIWGFAKEKLKKVHAYNLKCGNFVEYNSPTYTGIAIEEVSRMIRDFNDTECLQIAEKLNYMLWRTLALHFHAKTKQWAGPHGRAYTDFTKRNLIFIKYATDGEIDLIPDTEMTYDPSWNGVSFNCPREFYPYFQGTKQHRIEACVYNADIIRFYEQKAYSYIAPDYTLGSLSFSDMWNQRRAVIGYFGTDTAPKCIRMRFMHDNYDYSSAILNSVQNEEHITGVIDFCTDGGDVHMNMDAGVRKSISANDMRLRVEINGCNPDIQTDGENRFVISYAEQKYIFKILDYCFCGHKGFYEITQRENSAYIDFVLYSNIRREFSLEDSVYIAFSLDIGETEPGEAYVTVGKKTITVHNGSMVLEAGRIPAPIKRLSQQRKAVVNNIIY